MLSVAVVMAAIAIACWLWARAWNTPPPDDSSVRRLRRELGRHRQDGDT